MSLQELQLPVITDTDSRSLRLPSVPDGNIPRNEEKPKINLPDFKSLGISRPNPVIKVSAVTATRKKQESSSYDVSNGAVQNPQDPCTTFSLTSSTFPSIPPTTRRLTAISAEIDSSSVGDVDSVMSLDEVATSQRAPSVSMDDPDVRIAAEALSGLGNPDFVRSPSRMSISAPQTRRDSPNQSYTGSSGQDSEPLLSLLTTSHPWLGGTINNSLSAYSSTKSHSPRFIQYGAELVERKIGTPVVHTAELVSRKTGVESGLRRYFGNRRLSDLESGDRAEELAAKRRRVASHTIEEKGPEESMWSPAVAGITSRRHSQNSFETLPPYDDHMSPEYEEQSKSLSQQRRRGHNSRSVSWSTQLMITTSGLGVALSEPSLRSLRFCLGLLRSATGHLGNVMRALKIVLDDFDRAMGNTEPLQTSKKARHSDVKVNGTATDEGSGDASESLRAQRSQESRMLAERMKALGDDILNTLKTVVNIVSRYAGGALPDNASTLVRRQLLSVPYRWRTASQMTASASDTQNGPEAESVRSAYRMLAFAKEGLDMMAQVSLIVDATIFSAERWLHSMGKGKQVDNRLEMDTDGAEATGKEASTDVTGRDAEMVDAPPA